ncbi:hypothetical protein M0805_008281 [Coniferiporia weirii]|nr:hypothetical protein M0805_008281 [Coniferiporia weirii]
MGVSARRPYQRPTDDSVALMTLDPEAKHPGGGTRRNSRRNEGAGGSDGIVLSMSLIGDGIYSAIYTVPVTVGESGQSLQIQVDTGSADLWLASNSCGSQACTNNKAKLYNPSSSTNSQKDFQISYLSGEVDGPIVWDKFVLGGYEIDNQALAAANTVVNEALQPGYSGILGLALPLDSVIAQDIPPVTGNVPDGAAVSSNIFGSSPAGLAPPQFFFSVLLERPGSSRIPSVLGIGRHPSDDLLPQGPSINPSNVTYSTPLSESDGVHFWKVELRALTVYVNGVANYIDIGRSVSGNVFPEAVLDTGVPYIISTPAIANAVWGALGIGPASDGNYYVPCTTPLNMTVTLDDRTEIPLHPLDLSAISNTDTSSSTCTGLFQQSSVLNDANGVGDIILGVPFLRNVYTVMAYEAISSGGIVGNTKRSDITPRLGLLNLTDPTTAMEEFNRVRVQNQPLDGNNASSQSNNTSSHGLSVGLKVLFGLLGFIVLCAALFFIRWFVVRRRLKDNDTSSVTHSADQKADGKEIYALAEYRGIPQSRRSQVPSEDTQRTLRNPNDPLARLDAKYERSKTSSVGGDEFGFRQSKKLEDTETEPVIGDANWEPHSSWIDAYSEYQPALHGEWRPPAHERSYSSSSVHSARSAPSVPLLDAHSPRDVDEFGVAAGMVGAGRRGSFNDDDLTLVTQRPHLSTTSISSSSSLPRPRPRSGRPSSGPRSSSMMSRVISADDLPS